MKKIVFFTPSLNIGGIERVLLTYAHLLSQKGYDVTYLTCYDSGVFLEEINNGVKLHNFKTNKLRNSIFKLSSYLFNNKPDAIIVANAATVIVLIAKLLAFSSTKIITSHHNYNNVEVKSLIDRKIIWKVYNRCNSVIAISKGIYSFLKNNGVKESKIRLIYNPIDFENVIRMSKEPVNIDGNYILFVGRVTDVKNLIFLIKSYYLFHKSNPLCKLVIVGDGPERENLVKLTRELQIESSVEFVGAVANPYPYIFKSKVIVLSSFSEAFPTILLEGLTLGKTIVATPTKGAMEILDEGALGYVTKSFNDVEEFSYTMEYAINHPINKELLIDAVYKKYNTSYSIEKLEKIL